MSLEITVKIDASYVCEICGVSSAAKYDKNVRSASSVDFTNGFWAPIPDGWSIYSAANKIYCPEHFLDGFEAWDKRGGYTD